MTAPAVEMAAWERAERDRLDAARCRDPKCEALPPNHVVGCPAVKVPDLTLPRHGCGFPSGSLGCQLAHGTARRVVTYGYGEGRRDLRPNVPEWVDVEIGTVPDAPEPRREVCGKPMRRDAQGEPRSCGRRPHEIGECRSAESLARKRSPVRPSPLGALVLEALASLGGAASAGQVRQAVARGGRVTGQRSITRTLRDLAAADPPRVDRLEGRRSPDGSARWRLLRTEER